MILFIKVLFNYGIMKRKFLSIIALWAMFVSPLSAMASDEFKVLDVKDLTKIENWSLVWAFNIKFSKDLESAPTFRLIEDSDNISSINRDYNDTNKAIVNLSSELKWESSYILLSILWASGNIAFSTPSDFIGLEILNEDVLGEKTQEIEKIKITNSSQIEVYFTSEIEEDLSMKIIRDIEIITIPTWSITNEIMTSLPKSLESFTNYTLAVVDAKSVNGDTVSVDNTLFDFRTGDYSELQETVQEMSEKEETFQVMELAHREDNKLPDSGTKENIIIIMSLLLGMAVVFRNKLIKI